MRCVFRPQGCEVICALESVHRHEQQCDYALLNCSNAGTYIQAYKAISWYHQFVSMEQVAYTQQLQSHSYIYNNAVVTADE